MEMVMTVVTREAEDTARATAMVAMEEARLAAVMAEEARVAAARAGVVGAVGTGAVARKEAAEQYLQALAKEFVLINTLRVEKHGSR